MLLYELLTGTTPFDAKELMSQGIDAMQQTIREQEPVRPSTRLTRALAQLEQGRARPGRELGSARASRAASGASPEAPVLQEAAHAGGHQDSVFGGAPKTAREARALPTEEDTARTARALPGELRTMIHALRGDLDWIVMRCLEKDRTRRYETANGLAADLKRHLNHEPVVARPPSATYRFQKAWRRNRLVFAAGAAVAVALVVGLGVSLVTLHKARLDRARALQAESEKSAVLAEAEAAGRAEKRQRERAQAELWNVQLSEARALRIAGEPGARFQGEALRRQLVCRPDLTEAQVLALRQEAIGQLALVDLEVRTNFVATTGCWLSWDEGLGMYAQACGNGDVEVLAYPSHQLAARLPAPSDAASNKAVFSPEGRFLAVRFLLPSGAIRVWELASRHVVVQSRDEQPANDFDPLFFTPDSRQVAIPTRNGLLLQALEARSVPRPRQPGRVVRYLTFTSDSRRLAVSFADGTPALEI